MAFQFPASPIIGDVFTPVAGVTYKWNGTGWVNFSNSFITIANGDARYQERDEKGVASGYAGLDAGALVARANLNPFTGGVFGFHTGGDNNYGVDISPQNAAGIGLRVRGNVAQAGNLQEWAAVAGTVLSAVGPDGNMYAPYATGPWIASIAQMIAMASANLMVTPARMLYHPGIPKAVGFCQSTGAIVSGYGIGAVNIPSPGQWILTWTNAFASAAYAVFAIPWADPAGTAPTTFTAQVQVTGHTNTGTIIATLDGNHGGVTTNGLFVAAFGDLA